MKVILDYDIKKHQAFIISDNIDIIREHFSYSNKNAYFSKRFNPYAPTRKYMITPTGRYDVGLTVEIIKFIKSQNIAYELTITDPLSKILNQSIQYKELYKSKLTLRDYQEESTIAALRNGYGIIVLPTGAGKTLIAYTLIQTIREASLSKKCLIIVPSIQLVSQTYADFITYGLNPNEITKWTGNNTPNLKANIIVANSSILLSEKQDTSILSQIDLLLVDEVHKLKGGNEISKLLKDIKTNRRFGLTGTLPEDQQDIWNIIGKIGPVVYKKESEELRSNNYISNILIKIIKIKYTDQLDYSSINSNNNPTDLYNVEYNFIQNNKFRNDIITKLTNNLNQNCLILVDRIEHGQTIFNLLNTFSNKQIFFIQGSVELEDREVISKLMEEHNNVICIAMSAIFSTGINIKNIHYILFTSAGKAKVKVIQSIGRGVRLHKDKVKLIVYDIADCLQYSLNHLSKRINLYDEEKIEYEIKEINQD